MLTCLFHRDILHFRFVFSACSAATLLERYYSFKPVSVSYLSYIFENKKLRMRSRPRPWTFLVSSLPWVVAGLVAMSRTRDYHHHFSDILAGTVLGSAIGVYCYGLYFERGEREGEPRRLAK